MEDSNNRHFKWWITLHRLLHNRPATKQLPVSAAIMISTTGCTPTVVPSRITVAVLTVHHRHQHWRLRSAMLRLRHKMIAEIQQQQRLPLVMDYTAPVITQQASDKSVTCGSNCSGTISTTGYTPTGGARRTTTAVV